MFSDYCILAKFGEMFLESNRQNSSKFHFFNLPIYIGLQFIALELCELKPTFQQNKNSQPFGTSYVGL